MQIIIRPRCDSSPANLPVEHIPTIKDKSVDTFEQNKRFLSVSFRYFKKVFFVDR